MSLFEIRHYRVFPGKMDEWVHLMEHRVVPYFAARGMMVTGMFRGEKDEDQFTYIRRFDDEAHRAALYESEEWQSQIKPLVRQCIDVDKTIVHRVTETRYSPMR